LAAVWQIITMFTDIALDELNGDLINRLENILTLGPTLHKSFGRLDIWLEPIEVYFLLPRHRSSK
jgi:hypothetical protein